MPDNKYIVTENCKTSRKTKLNVCDIIQIDTGNFKNVAQTATRAVPKPLNLDVGSVIERLDDKVWGIKKCEYVDCKPAIVLSTDMISGEDISRSYKLVCAFSKEFGDIRLKLKTKSPFFYTKSGDEIMVSRTVENNEPRYEIATNKTVDEMRAKFLQNQKQK